MLTRETFFKENNHIVCTQQYLVAVSGGLDSMVLLHLVSTMPNSIQVAHINYQLRGQASDMDAQLVEDFCTKHQIVFHKKVIDTKAYLAENKLGLQEGARNIRYQFFTEIIGDNNIKILTAHHANDNVETVLMHIARGTGFKGLTGIPVINKTIIRPLLHYTRAQIEAYATLHEVPFRTDASNSINDYTRNAIRNTLLPTWQKIQPSLQENIIRNIEVWNGAYAIYNQHIKLRSSKLLLKQGTGYAIPIALLQKQGNENVWLYELLQPLGFASTEINEVHKLLHAENGKYFKNEVYKVFKDNKFLKITPINTAENEFIIIENKEGLTSFALGQITFAEITKPATLETKSNNCYVSIDLVIFPIVLRKAKPGDYFYPLGMGKKKKISKLLIDLKLTQAQKDAVWVLESNNKIIWVIGHRMDERFKVKPNATQVMQLLLKPNNG